MRFLKATLLLLVFTCLGAAAFSQDKVEGMWWNDDKSAKLQIYKAKDNKFYGKLAWLKEPNRNGKPKLDDKNPNEKLRSQPIQGLVILKGFEKDGDNEYEDGTIYDPKSGKTYSCKMKLDGNKLNVRGYIGVSLIGRTTTFTRVD